MTAPVHPGGERGPVFVMPRCHRHFFTEYRWWCRGCRREAESQFREVCEALWAGSTPQAPTVDEPDLGPWCCYAEEVGYPGSECSPENPIHAPTHCGYDNVRRGLVAAPTADSVPDELQEALEALAEARPGWELTYPSTVSMMTLVDAVLASAGVSSDR